MSTKPRGRGVKQSLGALVLLVAAAVFGLWTQGDSDPQDGPSAGSSVSSTPATKSTPVPSAPKSTAGTAKAQKDPVSGLDFIEVAELPAQAHDVLDDIDAGGPYDYPSRDGTTFGNFEGVLPSHKRGYYEEFTVETPGVSHRGARRIVTGDGGEFYWTADHYESFERIRR